QATDKNAELRGGPNQSIWLAFRFATCGDRTSRFLMPPKRCMYRAANAMCVRTAAKIPALRNCPFSFQETFLANVMTPPGTVDRAITAKRFGACPIESECRSTNQ